MMKEEDISFRRFLREVFKNWRKAIKEIEIPPFVRGGVELFTSLFLGMALIKTMDLPDWIIIPFILFGLLRFAYWDWRDKKRTVRRLLK